MDGANMQIERTQPLEASRVPAVAALKRLFELWAFYRDFHDGYLADPAAALASSGLDVDPRAASLVLLHRFPEGGVGPLPETFVWYRDFVEGRFARTVRNRSRYEIKDPRFRDWRARQIRRCQRDMPYMSRFMHHLSVAFELSLGCSVGCPFCALSAGKLQGIFRHTEEHAALWRETLARLHNLIGDSVSSACLYCATEPLDNPDYELFLADFYDEFGCVPQTTSAAATRDLERTRRLLRWGQETDLHFDRLSMLSTHDCDVMLDAFTAEELLYTDLLPQFPESSVANIKKAGRNIDNESAPAGTIACVSGFIINMVEKSVRLVTPVDADEEHPTGEIIYEKAGFEGADGLEDVVREMIERHMRETITIRSIMGMGS